MKLNQRLMTVSLIVLLLFMVHITDDVLHASKGLAPREVVISLTIMLVMLLGTVELAGRRVGFVITLLGGLASATMPFVHGMGPSATRWGFMFIWTLFALGVLGTYAALLSVGGLWRSFLRPGVSDSI